VAEEVAWSRNSGEYLETLTMMSDLHRAIDKFTMSPDLRYTGTLARLLPRDTVIYGAAPNLVDRADVFFQALEEALNGNSQLAEAWNSEKGLEVQAGLEELKDLVYGMEGLFGEELVFAVSGTEETDFMPLVLTEAPNPSAVAAEIEAVNDRISAKTEGFRPFVIISDPAAAGTEGKAVYTWLGNGLFAVSPSLELLRQVAAAEASGGSDGFAGNPLYETVAARYDQGVD